MLALALAIVLGCVMAAYAVFKDSTLLAPLSIGTATVAAPGSVSAADTDCRGITMTVRVSWTLSDSPRVTGYRVAVTVSNGGSFVVQTDATATSVQQRVRKPNAAAHWSVTATVMTLTDYGWTSQAPRTAPVSC